ncbi:hypothetical protein IQ250_26955 [Pseudanabaenaceae cyanobacterium LEGE 13415]|nr:hypothetical protein [Pseudanabaenaceae cyanobacterium LEGE 13415]
MKVSQWRVRREVMIPALAISAPLTIAFVGLIIWLEHPVRIWMVGGAWCVRVSPDGTEQIRYGDECGRNN